VLAITTMSFHGQLFMYLAAVLLPLVLADVAFTKPAAGDVITGTSLVAAWTESHQNPSISTFESYQLFLCAGGNNETEFVGHPRTVRSAATDNRVDSIVQPPTLCDLQRRQQVVRSSINRMGREQHRCILPADAKHERLRRHCD
jgi:hypothetical protein